MGNEGSKPGDYVEPVLPHGILEVRISVYKLSVTGYDMFDNLAAGAAGAYHTACVVAGWEYAFGGHDDPGKSGVYRSPPERDPNYIFFSRVVVGQVMMTPDEVKRVITDVAPKWPGTGYDLVERNCNHFASELCWLLVRKRPPAWINETADTLAISRQRSKTERDALAQSLEAYRCEFMPRRRLGMPEPTDETPKAPGEAAFQDTFTKTFDIAWKQGWAEGEKVIKGCGEDQDPVELKADVLSSVLLAATKAAEAAAGVVASAARAAAAAREAQPLEGLAAWDAAWRKESHILLQSWREAALADQLRPEDDEARAHLVAQALDIAAKRAAAAASAVSTEDAADASWHSSCTHELGFDIDVSRARLIDGCMSITEAVEGLNSGEISCPEGFCFVYSESRHSYFLVYRSDRRALAYKKFGIAD